ncbi:alpha/beta fold hydrolase [Larkinella harenae]
MNRFFTIVLFITFVASSTWASNTNSLFDSTSVQIKTDSLNLFDKVRNRLIPVALYMPQRSTAPLKLAVLSHGYGGTNKAYSFIAHNLVAHGYLVASIQHELPTDEPIPTTGNPYEVRMPNWKRGSENIHFVIKELQKQKPDLDADHVLLIGHSNGGDMSMLFAQQYPTLVSQVISLDNRRMPLPRVRTPRILSIRSSDQIADKGVLPTIEEQRQFGIRIVQLPDTIHNDMWDGATTTQKQEINKAISDFID